MIVRMCITCRARFDRELLFRFKLCNEKIVEFDGVGRSFYVCLSCVNKNKTKGVLQKILKTKEIEENFEELKKICHLKLL